MRSLTRKYLESLSLNAAQASAMRSLGESRGRQQLYERQRPEKLEALRTDAIVESTDASNRLEGITAPKARLEAIVTHSTEPRNRSEREIAGYRDALELIHESRDGMPVTTGVILQIHRLIYRYMPDEGGRWKPVDNEIVEKDEDGKILHVRFRPMSAIETPQAMEDLAQSYARANRDQIDPLLVIPLSVLDFLCIHPFRDGNGRTARLLTLLLLYHADYRVGRYISLDRIFEKSRTSYYETLEKSSQGWHEGKHDAAPWVEYFWGVLTRAYREFEERVGSVETRRGSKSDHVRAAIMRKALPFGISDLERDSPDVSRETIRLVLREMKREGQIRPIGRGRGARWEKVEPKP